MPALEEQFLKDISVEICRRKSPQNTEKHKTKLCAEVPERPLPKDPFFSAAEDSDSERTHKKFKDNVGGHFPVSGV